MLTTVVLVASLLLPNAHYSFAGPYGRDGDVTSALATATRSLKLLKMATSAAELQNLYVYYTVLHWATTQKPRRRVSSATQ